jgi:CubicO group peptidase (beta-lactamase class C family)
LSDRLFHPSEPEAAPTAARGPGPARSRGRRRRCGGPAGIPGLHFGADPAELSRLARTYWFATKPVRVAGTDLTPIFESDNNLPQVVTAFVPGAGVVCDAADLAAFYDVLAQGVVTRSGKRLVSEQTLERYTTLNVSAIDKSNRVPLRVGCGFLLGSVTPCIFGWWGTQRCFGHAGAFCTLAFADPGLGLAVAIVTNGNRGPYDSLLRPARQRAPEGFDRQRGRPLPAEMTRCRR